MAVPQFPSIRLAEAEGGRVVTLTFDTNEKGNIITRAMLKDIAHALDHLEASKPRVLVLQGGKTDFSRGVDPAVLDSDETAFLAFLDLEFSIWRRVELLPFITIAALRGYAVGNAAELALACDFRIAAPDARLYYPEMHVGFTGPAQRLSRFVGVGKAKEILLEPIAVGGEEALRLGLFTRLVPAERFDAEVTAFAAGFAGHPPVAVELTKKAIAEAYARVDGESLADRLASAAAYRTDDRRRGIEAMRNRTKPDFTGR